MTLGIQVLVWDKHIHMAGLNVLMGSKLSRLITISNGNT
jgi:hypothetical protein